MNSDRGDRKMVGKQKDPSETFLSTVGLSKASARKVYGVVYGVVAAGHFGASPIYLRALGSLREG